MSTSTGATTTRTQYLESNGRKLAHRITGQGDAIILCNRFRGTMDDWDPAFIDALAVDFTVIIFDYTGVGLSSGDLPTEIELVANDVRDLAAGLDIPRFVIGGWSYGGLVAQTFSVHYPSLISHTILIGTKPAGQNAFPMEQLFIETSSHVHNDLKDVEILFFEPASANSRAAAAQSLDRMAQRTTDKDIPVPEPVWSRYFQGAAEFTADGFNTREKLMQLQTPVLVLSGDHDLVFPVENWYALTRKMTNLFLVVLPESGHGPQHQYPILSASYITHFIRHYQQ